MHLKNLTGLFSGLMVILSTPPSVADGNLGLGVMVGDPTGVSVHYWLSKENALHLGMGWDAGDRDIFHLNADYLFYDFHTIRVDAGNIPFYYGLGLRLVDEDRPKKDLNLGIRVPVGLHFFFKSSPVDIFLEVAPVVELTPDTDFTIDGSLGIHYRFR